MMALHLRAGQRLVLRAACVRAMPLSSKMPKPFPGQVPRSDVQYGKKVAYTGPIYSGYKVSGRKVTVSFEKESLFGGLMIGSKGMAKDRKEPGKFVEPAKPTPGAKLNHFRLCGKDGKWHAAEARIAGDVVVVASERVEAPVGVQYAYSAVPENSNLYNKAGLPATPFAVVDGKFIFEEDDLAKAAALKAAERAVRALHAAATIS